MGLMLGISSSSFKGGRVGQNPLGVGNIPINREGTLGTKFLPISL